LENLAPASRVIKNTKKHEKNIEKTSKKREIRDGVVGWLFFGVIFRRFSSFLGVFRSGFRLKQASLVSSR